VQLTRCLSAVAELLVRNTQNATSSKGRSEILPMIIQPKIDFCCFQSPLHSFINWKDLNIVCAIL